MFLTPETHESSKYRLCIPKDYDILFTVEKDIDAFVAQLAEDGVKVMDDRRKDSKSYSPNTLVRTMIVIDADADGPYLDYQNHVLIDCVIASGAQFHLDTVGNGLVLDVMPTYFPEIGILGPMRGVAGASRFREMTGCGIDESIDKYELKKNVVSMIGRLCDVALYPDVSERQIKRIEQRVYHRHINTSWTIKNADEMFHGDRDKSLSKSADPGYVTSAVLAVR